MNLYLVAFCLSLCVLSTSAGGDTRFRYGQESFYSNPWEDDGQMEYGGGDDHNENKETLAKIRSDIKEIKETLKKLLKQGKKAEMKVVQPMPMPALPPMPPMHPHPVHPAQHPHPGSPTFVYPRQTIVVPQFKKSDLPGEDSPNYDGKDVSGTPDSEDENEGKSRRRRKAESDELHSDFMEISPDDFMWYQKMEYATPSEEQAEAKFIGNQEPMVRVQRRAGKEKTEENMPVKAKKGDSKYLDPTGTEKVSGKKSPNFTLSLPPQVYVVDPKKDLTVGQEAQENADALPGTVAIEKKKKKKSKKKKSKKAKKVKVPATTSTPDLLS